MSVLFHFLNDGVTYAGVRRQLEKVADSYRTSNRAIMLGAVLTVATAFGFGLPALGEWALGAVVWPVSGLLVILKLVSWKVEKQDWKPVPGQSGKWEPKTHRRVGLKALLALVAVAVCGFLTVVTILRKPDDEPWSNLLRRPSRAHSTISASPPAPKEPLTLKSLFLTDFPNLYKFTLKDGTSVNFENNQRVTIVSQAYADFGARSLFVGYYIPATPLTFRVCVRIGNPGSTQSLVDALNRHFTMQMYDDSLTSFKDLTLTGRVLIYHEEPLTLKQKATLVDYYKSRNQAVQFFGIEYLQNQAMARRLKQQQP
jgi:hypothetical protein